MKVIKFTKGNWEEYFEYVEECKKQEEEIKNTIINSCRMVK